MKQRFITRPAAASITEIMLFIGEQNPIRAVEYHETVIGCLARFDERFLPRQAHEELPGVYAVSVPGFRGYVVWVAVTDEAIAAVAAFRPGLTSEQQTQRARPGLYVAAVRTVVGDVEGAAPH